MNEFYNKIRIEVACLIPDAKTAYNRKWNWFRINNSDTVIADGKECKSQKDKLIVIFEGAKSLETSNKTAKGNELSEIQFIKKNLNRFNELYAELEKSEYCADMDLVNPIKNYIDYLNLRLSELSPAPLELKAKAKHYAAYHWLLIEIGKEKPFLKNDDDKYPKADIIKFAKNRYSLNDGQGFYNEFRNIDTTNKVAFARHLGKDYKNIIFDISNNDKDIISALKEYPN